MSVFSRVTLTSAKVMLKHVLPDEGMANAEGVGVPKRLTWALCIIIYNTFNVRPYALGFICGKVTPSFVSICGFSS